VEERVEEAGELAAGRDRLLHLLQVAVELQGSSLEVSFFTLLLLRRNLLGVAFPLKLRRSLVRTNRL